MLPEVSSPTQSVADLYGIQSTSGGVGVAPETTSCAGSTPVSDRAREAGRVRRETGSRSVGPTLRGPGTTVRVGHGGSDLSYGNDITVDSFCFGADGGDLLHRW